jgi:hypothetical protein
LIPNRRASASSAGPSVTLPNFDRLAAKVTAQSATVGIAIAAPGRSEVYSLGPWSAGVAWSTIKVPLAVAALRADCRNAEPLVVKAITESDNPASEALWSQLAEPADAARLVQAVLEAAGDSVTVVESRRLRAGFTAFGQTQWSLEGQARFAANLGAVPEARMVVDLMRNLVAGQRWGLAAKGFAAKGGWGPGSHSDYLVRQFGIVPVAAGHLGVALAVEAHTFEDGVHVIDQLVEWLFSELPELAQQ